MDKRKVAQKIDFSQLLQGGEIFVVHCKTEDDAINFLHCLKQEYPDRLRRWEEGITHWGEYDTVCYRPNLNMPDGHQLKYCNLEYYVSRGYTIIPYEDLIIQPDIAESDQSIRFLIECVV